MKNERDCAAWSKSLYHDGSRSTYAEGMEGRKPGECKVTQEFCMAAPLSTLVADHQE